MFVFTIPIEFILFKKSQTMDLKQNSLKKKLKIMDNWQET